MSHCLLFQHSAFASVIVWLMLMMAAHETNAFLSPSPLPIPLHNLRATITPVEANVIQSIRDCQSLQEIHRVLEIAVQENNDGEEESSPGLNLPPESRVGPNVAAVALCKTVDIRNRNKTNSKESLVLLLENVATAVVRAAMHHPSRDVFTLYALSDILISLGKLSRGYSPKLQPVASRVCDLIEAQREDFVKAVGPKRLVACLKTLASLRLLDRTDFVYDTCHRLSRGDAIGTLSASDLSHVLGVCGKLSQHDEESFSSTTTTTPVMVATRAFMRRIRKRSVREHATCSDLCRALVAVQVLYRNTTDKMREEAQTAGYTLARELVAHTNQSTEGEVSTHLSTRQMAEALRACVGLVDEQSDPILSELCESLCRCVALDGNRTYSHVSQVMSMMQRMQLVHHAEPARILGNKFQQLVRQTEATGGPMPGEVNVILRSAALLHRRNSTVMEPFMDGARLLFLQEPVCYTFLSRCDCLELSNFAWFMSTLQWFDSSVLEALATRILEPDFCETCSPKAASRILGSFTALCLSSDTEDQQEETENMLSQLFHTLGPQLLSVRLDPVDASSALVAYAKASYVQDMGIFDHLAEQLALRLEQCTIRQVAQSLWACGKMMVFENELSEESGVASPSLVPPYLTSARQFATFLSSRANQLTTKDVAQSIWACGRLGITDLPIVYALAYRAQQVSSSCTSQEVANMLWGLARVGFNDEEIVSVLTSQIIRPSVKPTTQEVANSLYALGCMNIYDENVFSKLTNVMMSQLHDASAQAIANSLWAYRTVRVPPPQELIDRWAMQKLGLVGVVSQSEQWRID